MQQYAMENGGQQLYNNNDLSQLGVAKQNLDQSSNIFDQSTINQQSTASGNFEASPMVKPMNGIQPFVIPGKNTPKDNEPIVEQDEDAEQTHEAQTPKNTNKEKHFPDDSSSDDLSRDVQKKLVKEDSLKTSIAQILEPEAKIKDININKPHPKP